MTSSKKLVRSALLFLMPVAASPLACSSGAPSGEAPRIGHATGALAAFTKDVTVLTGAAAEAALDPKRRAKLDELEKATGSHPVITVDAETGALLTMDLGAGLTFKSVSGVKAAFELVRLYQPLLDPKIDPSEYVLATDVNECGGATAVFDRRVAGTQVIGSRLTMHFSSDGALVRVINGVASVSGTVRSPGEDGVSGTPLDKLLPPKLVGATLPRTPVLVPSPDGLGLIAGDLVSWYEEGTGDVSAVVVGRTAITERISSSGAGRTAKATSHIAPSAMPDLLSYRGVGGVGVNMVSGDRNPAELAYRFLEEHPSIYRTGAARCQYAPKGITVSPKLPGVQFVRLEQRHVGVPVFGNELIFQIEGSRILSVSGRGLPRVEVDPRPAISAADADAVVQGVLGDAADAGDEYADEVAAALAATPVTRLVILPGSLATAQKSIDGGPSPVTSAPGKDVDRLAWEVKRRHIVMLVDASTSNVLYTHSLFASERFDTNDAGNRSEFLRGLYSRASVDGVPTGLASPMDTNVTPADSALPAIDRAYLSLGWNGVNGRGAPWVANTNVAISSGCLNAFFDSSLTNEAFFCLGMAVTDVVGHEMTHGVVAASSRLVYSDQSGAINEAYADLMGNLIFPDAAPPGMTPGWLVGETAASGAIRNMANPGAFGQPGTMDAYVPRTSAAGCGAMPWSCDNGGVHTNSGIINRAHVLLTAGVTGLTTGIGRPKMSRLGFETMTSRLTPAALMNDVPRATMDMCQTLVARGIRAPDGSSFVQADCDQIPIAFNQVGLATDLSSGWVEPTIGFSGTQTMFAAGDRTSTGCAVTDIRGSLSTLSGDLPFALNPSSGLASSTNFLGLYGVGFAIPPGSGPVPFPIGTTVKTHTVNWFDIFGSSPRYETHVLATPPGGAADCATPAMAIPVQRVTGTNTHFALFGASGDDTIGNAASTMDPRCTIRDTSVEIVDAAGNVLPGSPGRSVRHRVTHQFLFITVNYDQNATITGALPTAPPNLSTTVHWQFAIGRESRFRLRYLINQPAGVTCTP